MNKTQFVAAYAARADVDEKTAAVLVNAFLALITERLVAGEAVVLTGFGKFAPVHKNEEVKYPFGGPAITLPRRTVPRFTAGTQLRAAVAGKAAS